MTAKSGVSLLSSPLENVAYDFVCIRFFVLWHINCCELFNAYAIPVEKKVYYY